MYDEQSNNTPPQSTCPAISVIVPLYNSAKYIGEALDSLLAQTFQDFEVISIDDCSTDNSVEIVEGYAEKFNGRLKLAKMETEKNSGRASFPRNKGIELAQGEYLTFLDPDDSFVPEALELFYKFAKEHDADVVQCEKYYELPDEFYNDAERRKEVKPLCHPSGNRRYVTEPTLLASDPEERVLDFCRRRWLTWAVWLQLIRRELVVKNKITFPNTHSEDIIFVMCEMCVAKNYLVIPNTFYWYRVRQDSVVRQALEFSERARRLALEFRSAINHLDEFLNRQELFAKRADIKYAMFETYTVELMNRYGGVYSDVIVPHELDEFFREGLGGNDSAADSYFLNMFGKSYSKPLPISVIIPMYNAEKYIGECLESILVQTFRDFEVIVVDDCSTDGSFNLVLNYALSFGGRLKLAKTKKNSGTPGEPGNIGVSLARGEYLFIMDNDDTITPDALEKLYSAAKEFKADVVTCEKYYDIPEEHWDDEEYRKNLALFSPQKGGFVDKPTLIPFHVTKRVQDCFQRRFAWPLWTKLIRRDYLVENQIHFQDTLIQDMLATCCLIYTAKRFVRVPYVINNRRVRKDSLYCQEREPLEQMKTYMRSLKVGFKYLDKFLSNIEFFQQNPEVKYAALKTYFFENWNIYVSKVYDQVPAHEREEALRKEFGGDDNTPLTMFLFDVLFETEKENAELNAQRISTKFAPFITARIDIKLMTTEGDFQIFSVSDEIASIWKPEWLQKNGIGYQIETNAGKLDFIAKSTVDGKIRLLLRGLDIRNPEDSSKKIPYWIDYTQLIVKYETIFDTLTPVWHDKSYRYDFNVKAGEEVNIQLEWQPHRSDT